jgi:hypothetical protein
MPRGVDGPLERLAHNRFPHTLSNHSFQRRTYCPMRRRVFSLWRICIFCNKFHSVTKLLPLTDWVVGCFGFILDRRGLCVLPFRRADILRLCEGREIFLFFLFFGLVLSGLAATDYRTDNGTLLCHDSCVLAYLWQFAKLSCVALCGDLITTLAALSAVSSANSGSRSNLQKLLFRRENVPMNFLRPPLGCRFDDEITGHVLSGKDETRYVPES